jgi:enediyne biosynthesis protein E5
VSGNLNPQIMRLRGLRRFALAITILNILGHTALGFEQSHAQTLIALLTAYSIELLLEYVEARSQGRRPCFVGKGWRNFVDFLLPAHITGLAVSMLLYANDRLLPFVFAAALAICSKAMFRVRFKTGSRHMFNPSNFGIAVTLLLFPAVGIAPPYMFTEGLGPVGSIAIISVIVISGSFLNATITKRMPLLLSWVGGFVLQALIRAFLHGQLLSILNATTGVAFLLFTFYMITDPGTTPMKTRSQILFGLSVALGYGALVMLHIVFGMFFSLAAVCLVRYGYFLYQTSRAQVTKPIPQPESIALPAVDVAYR